MKSSPNALAKLANMPSTLGAPELRSGAVSLASATPEETDEFLASLSENALHALPYMFEFWAMDHQVPPEGDWRSWVILGGRGAGKTRAGAEWVRSIVEGDLPLDEGTARRVALVGETFDQVRDVMVFGENGILACSPPDRRPEWQATRRRLVWPNGAIAECYSASSPEGLRGPQFDAAWVDELGCAAIDKGSNEPNKFVDAKSSESALPHFSSGVRDDYIQHQFLRAYAEFYATPENNPVSAIYDGPMVDMSKTHVWAWDARPWPDFPNNREVWSDGENYLTGHWITGRSSNQTLAAVVAELCEAAGITAYDVSMLHGVLRGFTVSDSESPRASIQTLMVVYAIDAVEANGRLVFRNRSLAEAHELGPEDHVLSDGGQAVVEAIRAPEAEVVGEVRLGYPAGDGAFESRVVSARFPDNAAAQITHNEVPLSLTRSEANSVAERWLSEARVARESLRLSVPASRSEIRAGDTLRVSGAEGAEYRVDRVEISGARTLEATRIERQIYAPSQRVESTPLQRAFSVPIPITAQFLDLPLLRGDEVPHAPYIAVSANPWPGSAAVYDAAEDAGYELNTLIERPSSIGVTATALEHSESGRWAAGQVVRVVLQDGALSSASRSEVLSGKNVLAIGDGSSDNWEILQFALADLIAPNTYDLSDLLRGQAGTDGLMPSVWPVGSRIVVLDGAPTQLEHSLSHRDLARHYRVGPGLRPIDDPSYRHYVEAFSGVGLRPYAPAHLRVAQAANAMEISWVRRTRIDGDSWASFEVPLGEDLEAYQVRIIKDDSVLREVTTTAPHWSYPAALSALDGAFAPFEVQVAQISQSFGPGPFARKIIDA